jgi:hypothetical protein
MFSKAKHEAALSEITIFHKDVYHMLVILTHNEIL